MSESRALATRIRANVVELEPVVMRAIQLYEKAIRSGDDGYWDGAALNLHGFYSGVERIFEDIARTNVYAFQLRPARVRELCEMISDCFTSVRQELLAFAAFLEGLN